MIVVDMYEITYKNAVFKFCSLMFISSFKHVFIYVKPCI